MLHRHIAQGAYSRFYILLGACTVAATVAAFPANAQQPTNSGTGLGPSQEEAQPLVPVPPPPVGDHLFGDWWGVRSDLRNMGIVLNFDYTSETASNISGGLRTGTDYAHQLSAGADIDWDKIAGLTGFSTHTVLVERAGRNASNDYIGDHVLQAQEIYGAGFGQAAHLVYMYGEEKLLDGRIDIAAGRFFPGVDFAASPLYCNFMTLTICGHPRALTSTQGFIDWPQNTWGGRIRVRPTAETYVMVGGFESQPFPGGGRSGFDFSSSKVTGATIPVELAWEPVFGPNQLLGHYKLGYVYDTSSFNDSFADNNDASFVLSGLAPRKDQGRSSFYATFDQMLIRTGPAQNQGLTILGAFDHNDPGTSLFRNFIWTGLLYSGFWPARPNDQIGLAYTWYQVSNNLTRTEEVEQQFGLPPTYAFGIQNTAGVIEANYNFPVYRGVQLQPEFEYFMRPGGVTTVHDAAVLGIKVHVSF